MGNGNLTSMPEEDRTLIDAWTMRNAAATAFVKTEDYVRRVIESASVEQLVQLIEAFSPTRSPGPDWTRSLEPLIEHLWAWRDAESMAALEATFRARGKPWQAVANAFTPERGERLREQLRRPAWARYPAFAVA